MHAYILTFLCLAGLAVSQEPQPDKPKHRITVSQFGFGEYPAIARQARIMGPVKVKFEYNGDRSLRKVSVVSGHPILVNAALDVAKKWKFVCFDCDYNEPYEHVFTVNFVMHDGSRPHFAFSFPDAMTIYADVTVIVYSVSSSARTD